MSYECMYCGLSLDNKDWFSEFMDRKHYKVTTCDCGKDHRLTFFDGSGHDSFNEEKSLELIIQTVRFDTRYV